jgi:hypothetical protein
MSPAASLCGTACTEMVPKQGSAKGVRHALRTRLLPMRQRLSGAAPVASSMRTEHARGVQPRDASEHPATPPRTPWRG